MTVNELSLERGVRKYLAIKKGINLSSEKETSIFYKRNWWVYERGLSALKPIFLYEHIQKKQSTISSNDRWLPILGLENSLSCCQETSFTQEQLQNESREFLACIPPLTHERAIREKTITSNFINLISSNKPCQSISWAEAGPQAAGAQVYNWFYGCLCGFAGVWLAGSQGGPISVYMDFLQWLC